MSDLTPIDKNFKSEDLDFQKKTVETHWGIKAVNINRLMGYEIATYSIATEDSQYILKQYPNNSLFESRVLFENKVLDHLTRNGSVPCPELIKTKKGDKLVRNQKFLFRLQTYLTGTFLAEAQLSHALLESIGRMLGTMDRLLVDIHGPYPLFDEDWDLKHALRTERLLNLVSRTEDRRLVSYFLHQFKAEVLPRQYDLPQQLIYADANEWNLLTEANKITGIIDFGDMCYSWRINELAIGLAYALMFSDSPLEDAVPMIRGYDQAYPLTETELDVLYYLIAGRLTISVCWSAKNKIDQPDNEYLSISEERAWKLLHRWIRINPELARKSFRKAIGMQVDSNIDINSLRAQRNKFLSQSYSLSYESPIPMVRAALQYMYDADGNTYLDAYNNIMLVGHAHPMVLEAGMSTYARLNTNTRYLYDELPEYAEKLLSFFPSSLCRVFFVNSGSAAADLALRMAYHHTGKSKCVALEEGYHGNTVATIAVSPYKTKKTKKPDSTVEIELPNANNLDLKSGQDPGSYFAKRAIETIQDKAEDIAAFIAEPIVGCGGQVPLPPGYLKKIYPAIRAIGGVCISDEVQVGFGRLGKVFWGFEMQEVVPDIVILGKPMANGHPIGAVVTTSAIAESFESGPEFFSSFGGNPVSCAIGSAVLDVIREEGLQQHALKVGSYFKDSLLKLQKEYPVIADVRGEGLFLGIEIATVNGKPDGPRAIQIANLMKAEGILVSTDGPVNQVIKIKPPLCFSIQNVDEFVRAFHYCLKKSGVD